MPKRQPSGRQASGRQPEGRQPSAAASGTERIRTVEVPLLLGSSFAQRLNLQLHSGDKLRLRCTLTDDAGTAIPLSDLSAIRWACSKRRSSTTFSSVAAISKSLGDGIEVADSDEGIFYVDLEGEDSEDLADVFSHELEVVDQFSNHTTLLIGTLRVYKDLLTG